MKKALVTLAVFAGLAVSHVAKADTNLIQNGNFANSNVTDGKYAYANGWAGTSLTVPSWTFTDGSGIANKSSAWGGVAQNQAVAFVQYYGGFTSNSPTISQTFSSSSSAYAVSFDIANRSGYGTESLTVTLDGQTVVASLAATGTSFSTYSYNVAGLTGTTHTLTFRGVGNTANDSSVFLTNVNVAAVPEPETYAMLLAGLGLLGAVARRKQK